MGKNLMKLIVLIFLLRSAKTAFSNKKLSFASRVSNSKMPKFEKLFFVIHPRRAVDLFLLQGSLRLTWHIINKYLHIEK